MATSTLVREWSLDSISPPAIAPSTCSPLDVKTIMLNSLIINRWGIHSLSTVIDVVPLSQDRLRNEGLIPFYKYLVTINKKLKEIALTQGVVVPPYPDACEDHVKECALDDEELRATLISHVAGAPAQLLDFGGNVLRSRHKYHWGTVAAQISVGAEIMSTEMATGKNAIGAMTCKELGPIKECVSDKVIGETTGVISEELMKCRSDAAGTGWREDEARELATEHVKFLKAFLCLPK